MEPVRKLVMETESKPGLATSCPNPLFLSKVLLYWMLELNEVK